MSVRFYARTVGEMNFPASISRWAQGDGHLLVETLNPRTSQWEHDTYVLAACGVAGDHPFEEITPEQAQDIAGEDVDIWPPGFEKFWAENTPRDHGKWTKGAGSEGEKVAPAPKVPGAKPKEPTGEKPPANPKGTTAARLAQFTRKYADAAFENALIIDRDGKELLVKAGSQNRVVFTGPQVAAMRGKDAVLVHNHPSGHGNLSRDDIMFASNADLKEIRAISWDKEKGEIITHSFMRPPGGWPHPFNLSTAFEDAKAALSSTLARVFGAHRMGKLTETQANRQYWGAYWKWLSDNRKLKTTYKIRKVASE